MILINNIKFDIIQLTKCFSLSKMNCMFFLSNIFILKVETFGKMPWSPFNHLGAKLTHTHIQ